MGKTIKNFEDFVNESNEVFKKLKSLKIDGKTVSVFYYSTSPFEFSVYAEHRGEPYCDISTNLPANALLDAMWVKVGGIEEQIADMLPTIFQKTDVITESGYNKYVMYKLNIKK